MTCQYCPHSFPSCLSKRAKSAPSLRAKVHPLTLEELKARLHLVQRVFARGHRGFRAPQGLRDHRVQWVFQDKGSQGYQEQQVPLVHRDTQESENLECLDSQENLGVLDYLDQKVSLVRVGAKGPQGLLGLGGCQVHLDSQGFPNQEGRASLASLGHLENLDRKASLGCLVLRAPREREGLDFLVYQA